MIDKPTLRQRLTWPRQTPLTLEVTAGSRRPGGVRRFVVRVFNAGDLPVRAGRPALVCIPAEARQYTLVRAHRPCYVRPRSCIRFVLEMKHAEPPAQSAGVAYRLVIPRRPWGITSLNITDLVLSS
ncbi:MAG: hypothetical protein WED00_10650 [Aquisalimonadaceae bacterium]